MFGFLRDNERIYIDYAAATPCRPECLRAMHEVNKDYGNPGALHAEGRHAAARLAQARKHIAHELGCRAREIVFVSGGTEGNNLAILGTMERAVQAGASYADMHVVTSAIEHPSVLECFAELERRGVAVTYVTPDTQGRLDPQAVAGAVTARTRLVSIGLANSEIGVVQPLSTIAEAVRAVNDSVLLHTDIGQALLYMHTQVHSLRVDLATLDSGKLYGPRGVGAVYIGANASLAPVLYGGGQERGLRPGSENVVLATGFASAVILAATERAAEGKRLQELRSQAQEMLRGESVLAGVEINGNDMHTLPHIVNISVPNIDSEYVVLALDQRGIAVSTKSSCREGEAISHVVAACTEDAWRARNTVRISMGRDTTAHTLRRFVRAFTAVVNAYRALHHPAPEA